MAQAQPQSFENHTRIVPVYHLLTLGIFVVNLLSGTLGPTSVALFTDHVFGRDGVRYSLATMTGICMAITLALFSVGLGSYRRTVEQRDDWIAANASPSPSPLV